MCGSMEDIHSATAEIRRGKKKRKKKPQGKNIMSTSATQGGHNDGDDSEVFRFLSMVTLTFVLDIQTRLSKGPNMSSVQIWCICTIFPAVLRRYLNDKQKTRKR